MVDESESDPDGVLVVEPVPVVVSVELASLVSAGAEELAVSEARMSFASFLVSGPKIPVAGSMLFSIWNLRTALSVNEK